MLYVQLLRSLEFPAFGSNCLVGVAFLQRTSQQAPDKLKPVLGAPHLSNLDLASLSFNLISFSLPKESFENYKKR